MTGRGMMGRGMKGRTPTVVALAAVALVAVALVAGCAPAGPRAIVAGDQCGYCRMEVTDGRFAAQVVTGAGKQHLFDSVECVAGFLAAADSTTVRGTWVRTLDGGEHWVPAERAGFLVDASVRAPMGRVIAFSSEAAAVEAQARLGGARASWAAVRTDSAGIAAHGTH